MYINSGDYFSTARNIASSSFTTARPSLNMSSSIWTDSTLQAGGFYNPFTFSPIALNPASNSFGNSLSFAQGIRNNFIQWLNSSITPYTTQMTFPSLGAGFNFNIGLPSFTTPASMGNLPAFSGMSSGSSLANNNVASIFGIDSLLSMPTFSVKPSTNSNYNTPAFGTVTAPRNSNSAKSTSSPSLKKASSKSTTEALSMSKPSIGQGYSLSLTSSNKKELARIENIFNKNRAKYEKVAKATGVPAELVCAIHYRESGCNFGTYLHNGQKLGKRTTIVPKGILFYDWSDAAIHAIKSQSAHKNVKSNNLSSQLDFAERYNGLGYRKKGVASPYVWAGTNKYTGGMYVADGRYSASKKDQRVGVAAILDKLYA